mmetsp:Transcript_5148/g.6228  ORF Transcript_5148/g.6228 Transcript_5148/m.6228 type:complete len:244 (-) Transcript_5148:813-1544(-)
MMTDPFLDSMTFAFGMPQGGGCDCCDECNMDGGSMVPVSVASAIRAHKRLKLMEVPVQRTQKRVLVTRESGISVWELVMPLDAEPLIEFGNSHRIIFVKKLKKGSIIKKIGKGIVGSSDEEKSRQCALWSEGKCYLLPSNGGKALGWTHEKDTSVEEKVDGHAIVYYIKITHDALQEQNDKEESKTSEFFEKVRNIFEKVLPTEKGDEGGNEKKSELNLGVGPLDELVAKEIQEMVLSFSSEP